MLPTMSDALSTNSSVDSLYDTRDTTPAPSSPAASSILSCCDLKEPRSLIPSAWREKGVRPIDMDEVKQAAVALSQAFAADELAQYLIEEDMDGISRWKLHLDIMTYIVAAHCQKGIVTTSGLDYEGIALWMPPGHSMDDWWTVFRSGMWRLYYQLSREFRKRYFDELLPLLHQAKKEIMGDRDNDCYYLVYIGTKPRCRGLGYGKKLINDMIERADSENRPVYLESSNVINNSYYRQFGFEEKKEIFLTRGATPVQLTIMVREPRPTMKPEVDMITSAAPVVEPVPSRCKKMVRKWMGRKQ